MVQKIKNEKRLKEYLREEIEDEGIKVEIDSTLMPEDYAAIKVDDYYNGLHISNPPKAIDFVVVVDCQCSSYAMYLLELKNVNEPKKLDIKSIQEKFQNTIEDFLSVRFKDIFQDDSKKYKKIKLYLVSDAYRLAGKYKNYASYKIMQEKLNKKDSLRVDMNLASKLYRFRGRVLRICFDIPPNPLIRRA